MNFDEMKKTGFDKIEILDSFHAPLLKLGVKLDESSLLSYKNELEVKISNSDAREVKVSFPLSCPLGFKDGISDEFLIEPVMLGNKLGMKAYVKRRTKAFLEENSILLGEDLSNRKIKLGFPLDYENSVNYFPGLFGSENYLVREVFANVVNQILLIDRRTNQVIDILYSNISDYPMEYVLPDDFGVVNYIIDSSSNMARALQYIKVYSYRFELQDNEKIEEISYSPVVLFEGKNVIKTNYLNAVLEVVYPKNEDFVKYFILSCFSYGFSNEDKFLTLDDLYFKDCFTKISDGLINALFNKLTIKCLNSTNSTFSLDCDGNMVVNTLTEKNKKESTLDFNKIYPIGSIYLSVNATNPATLFGGTWVQLKDRFLLSAGDTYKNGNTGGEATHKLVSNEMPSHNHTRGTMNITGSFPAYHYDGGANTVVGAFTMTTNNDGCMNLNGPYDGGTRHRRFTLDASKNWTGATSSSGANLAHNNMPPYLVVYMWKRTA